MTKSMTAFAHIEKHGIAWEIRSVNHRYLEIAFRMPEFIRVLESELRTLLKAELHRGKIDCILHFNTEEEKQNLSINEDLLNTLILLENRVSSLTGAGKVQNALEYLRWPGIVSKPDRDADSQHQLVTSLFLEALNSLIDMRSREGVELQQIIEGKLTQLSETNTAIRAGAPELVQAQQQKLTTRLSKLNIEADPGRLEQEMVFIASRLDIEEELDRLDTHIAEVRQTLQQNGSIGRRLDFLMQELNREANTLSSKTSTADLSLLAVDMKVTIEQMREQIQNIE
ncbi:MAG: YicC family protein [Gammaproteobacteria bacterium]|nr:YicC family protein [Gammaproteobacteria bacterium]